MKGSAEALREMVRELAEWRLAAHLHGTRADRRARIADDGGEPLDARFTTERADGGFAVIVESRGGKAGTKAARNTQYGEGLRLLLERLKALGATVLRVELATRVASGLLELEGYGYPIGLEAVADIDHLRRAIQRAHRNNPTRRIRVTVRAPVESAGRLHRALAGRP